MDGLDDLAAVDALEVNAGDAEVGVAELPLDHDELCHLDRVRVTKLVRREPPPDARGASRVMQLLARGGGFPAPTGGWSVDHAQERPDRELAASLKPWVSWSQAQRSIPISRRMPPYPRRTRTAPRERTKSLS